MQITYNVLIIAKKNEFENSLHHVSLIKMNNDQQVKRHAIKKKYHNEIFH